MGREERGATEVGAGAGHHREEGRGEEEGMEGSTAGEGARTVLVPRAVGYRPRWIISVQLGLICMRHKIHTYRDAGLRSGARGARTVHKMKMMLAPCTIADSALQGTHPPMANSNSNSDSRHGHGARNFGGEPAVPPRGLLLRHMEDMETTRPYGGVSMILPSGTISVYSAVWPTRATCTACEFSVNARGARPDLGMAFDHPIRGTFRS